jgi:hypothetical protein
LRVEPFGIDAIALTTHWTRDNDGGPDHNALRYPVLAGQERVAAVLQVSLGWEELLILPKALLGTGTEPPVLDGLTIGQADITHADEVLGQHDLAKIMRFVTRRYGRLVQALNTQTEEPMGER